MINIIFISIAIPCILECEGRLLVRTTERAFVSKNDDFKTVSITKHCLHGQEKQDTSAELESQGPHAKRSVEKARIPLVKKPIPTYVEINYDEDYQSRMARWPEKYSDSSENEDEDFNVDDYDFDVNHDEYATRGKPIEPRVKLAKSPTPKPAEPEVKSTPAVPKIFDEATQRNNTPSKRQETVINVSEKNKARADDYYDDLTTKPSENMKIVYSQEDVVEETDEGEYARKGSVRTVRSSWNIGGYVDKLGEKTSLIMNKVLSILPMFPQIPQRKNVQ
ncbi:unnamed protein product, partial [Iphiclides podalirius]